MDVGRHAAHVVMRLAHAVPLTRPFPGRCNAKRANGTYCRRYPLKRSHPESGHPRCARHGGAVPTGPDSPHWKGGTSRHYLRKHLPRDLIKRFDSVMRDPELVSVRGLMALQGARLTQLLDRLPSGQNVALMSQLVAHLREARDAKALPAPAAAALEEALALCVEARKAGALWDEIAGAMEGQRRLADTERRREEALQSAITGQQAVMLFHALFSLIVAEVKDQGTRDRLAGGLRRLLARESAAEEVEAEVVTV